jgi:hypothetical protein
MTADALCLNFVYKNLVRKDMGRRRAGLMKMRVVGSGWHVAVRFVASDAFHLLLEAWTEWAGMDSGEFSDGILSNTTDCNSAFKTTFPFFNECGNMSIIL